MTLPCWLCKCSINTSWIHKWMVRKSNVWLLHFKTQASPGQVPRQWLPTEAKVQRVVWLAPISACLLLWPDPYRAWGGHQRLQGWAGSDFSLLIGQAPSKAPVPGSAPLQGWADQRALQKLGFWAAPVLIINCHFGSDSRGSDMTGLPHSWGGHQRGSSKGQEAAWGSFGRWPLVGRKGRTEEAPKENIWSRITREKLLQARNLTLAFIFSVWNHEIWLHYVAGRIVDKPAHVYLHTHTHTHAPKYIHTPESPTRTYMYYKRPLTCRFSHKLKQTKMFTHASSYTSYLPTYTCAYIHTTIYVPKDASL